MMDRLVKYADTDEQVDALEWIEDVCREHGIELRIGAKVGRYPQAIILDYHYQDGAVYVSRDGEIEVYDTVVITPEDFLFSLKGEL